jgi:hypothetical protein
VIWPTTAKPMSLSHLQIVVAVVVLVMVAV